MTFETDNVLPILFLIGFDIYAVSCTVKSLKKAMCLLKSLATSYADVGASLLRNCASNIEVNAGVGYADGHSRHRHM